MRKNIIIMININNGCSSLQKLNLSNFNFANDADKNNKFFQYSPLKELNLSNFNTTNITNRCSSDVHY